MSSRRAHRAFWTLVVVAAISMGMVSSALTQHGGAVTGLVVAASGITVLVSISLAGRVMIALDRGRRLDVHAVTAHRKEQT